MTWLLVRSSTLELMILPFLLLALTAWFGDAPQLVCATIDLAFNASLQQHKQAHAPRRRYSGSSYVVKCAFCTSSA